MRAAIGHGGPVTSSPKRVSARPKWPAKLQLSPTSLSLAPLPPFPSASLFYFLPSLQLPPFLPLALPPSVFSFLPRFLFWEANRHHERT
jgi:hypothetical protein